MINENQGLGDGKVTPQEFAKRTKEKYPEYKDVPDDVLVQKMVEKYPEYKNKINFEKPKGASAGVIKSGGSQSTSANGSSSWASWGKEKTNTVGGFQFPKKSQPLTETERADIQQNVKLSDTGISKKDQERLIKQSEDRRPEIQSRKVTSEVDYQKGLERNYESTGDDSAIVEYLTKSPKSKYKQEFLLQSKSGEFLDIPTNPYENKADAQTIEETYKLIPNVDQSGANVNDFAGFLKERSDFAKQEKAGVFNNQEEKEFEINRLYNDYFSRKASLLNSKADILMNRSKIDGGDRSKELKEIGDELDQLGAGYNEYKKANLPNLYKAEQEKKQRDLKNYQDIKSGNRSILKDGDTAGQKFIDGFFYSVSDVLAAGGDVVGSDFLGDKLRLQKQYKTWESDTNTIPFFDKGKVVKNGSDTFIVTPEGSVIDKDTKTIVNGIFDPERLRDIINSSSKSNETETVFSARGATYAMSQTLGQLAFQLATTKGVSGALGKVGATGSSSLIASEMISVGSMVGTSAYNDTLNELKKAGIKEDEAKGYATQVGTSMALVGATSARFLPNSRSLNWVMQTGTREATREAINIFLRGGSEELKGFLKSGAVKVALGGLKEGGGEAVQETFENYVNQEVVNRNINKQIGQQVLDQNYTVKEAINDAALSFGAAGLTGAMGSSKKAGEYDTLSILSQDYDNFVRFGQEEVYRGKMSQSEFNDLKDNVEKFKKYSNKIPSNVEPDKILDLVNVLDEKNNLEEQKKNLDKVFHPELDEKIESLNNQVDEILNRTEPTPDSEQDEIVEPQRQEKNLGETEEEINKNREVEIKNYKRPFSFDAYEMTEEQLAEKDKEAIDQINSKYDQAIKDLNSDKYSIERMNSLPFLDDTSQDEYNRSLDVINNTDWSNPESAKQAASEIANIISGKNIPESKLESYLSSKLIPTDNVFTPEHLEKFINLRLKDFNVSNETVINNDQTTQQEQETATDQEGESTVDDSIPTETSEEISLKDYVQTTEGGRKTILKEKIIELYPLLKSELNKYSNISWDYEDLTDLRAVIGSKLMSNKLGATRQIEMLENVERLLEDTFTPQNNLKNIEQLNNKIDESDYTEEQKNLIKDIIGRLKTKSFFKFDNNDTISSIDNYYNFFNNVIKSKDAYAFVHEVGHWGFYNILSSRDRIDFYNYMKDRFYGTDNIMAEEMAMSNLKLNDGSNYLSNVADNFNEYFAEQFRQYVFSEIIPEKGIRKLYEKLKTYVNEIINSFKSKGYNKDLTSYFDKIIDSKLLQIDLEADLNEPTAFDKFINGIDKLINDIDESTKGTLGINILPVAAKGALQAIKQTAIATKNTVEAIKAGVEYLKKSDWYKNLSPDEKSDFDSKSGNEVFGDLLNSVKPNESVADKLVDTVTVPGKKSVKKTIRENTGQTDRSKKISTTESKLLKEKFKNLERGFKTGVKETNQFKKDFINQVKEAINGLGNHITETDAKTILNQVSKVNPKNIEAVSKIIDNLVSRLENRASKARINKLKSLQKRANVKARTKYGNAGVDIRKLTTLPVNQIPDMHFDEYYDLIEQLAKGQDVDFNKVSEMYQTLQDDINQFVENRNKEKADRIREIKDNTEEVDKFKVNVKKAPNLKNLTDFEREVISKLKKIPEDYIASLPKSEIAAINKALEALNDSGYVTNKVLSNLVMKYNSEVTASEVINTVGDRVLVPAKGIFNLIDKIRGIDYTSKDFTSAIGKQMLHHIQRAIKGLNGTLFYDNIIHPITSNFDKASVETNHIANKFTSLFNKAAKKNGFALNVKLQMYLRAREFESNPELRGKKVFSLEEHMKAMEENLSQLSLPKKDVEYIKSEYNKVKNLSSEEMFNNFTQDEKAVVEFMDKELSKSEIASRDFNNHLAGETLLYPKNYFPRKNSLVTGDNDVDTDIKNRLSGVLGSSSIKSEQSNERTATSANPLNFDTAGNFMSHIRQSNIEKNLGFTLKEVGMTVSNIKKSSSGSLVSLANSLDTSINNLLEAQLGNNPYSYDSKKEKFFKALVKNTFTRMLIDPIRLSYDVASNYSTVYGAHLDKLMDIRKANKNISNDVNAEIHKNISSTQSERLGGSRSSDYKNAMSSSLNQARNKTSEPSFGDRLLDLYRYNILSKFSEEGGNLYYKVADLPSQHLWKYYLSEEFKKISGQELDGKKYLEDKAYRESVKDDLQKAARSADKKTANYFNTGASAEQKLEIQVGKGNWFTRANNFLRSFTFNENRVFWDSLSGLTGIGDTTFDSKSEAFRAFSVINARGIMYAYLGQVVAGWLVKFAVGDDEEEEEAIDKKALKRSLGQHGMLIIGGNRGAAFNLVGNFLFEEVNKQIIKAEGGKYNPFENSVFFTPNSNSKYLDFLNNLGAEGVAVKTLVESLGLVYNIGNKIADKGKVTQEDLIKMKSTQISIQLVAQTFGLPLDRIGRITQKYLNAKKGDKKPMTFN